MERLSIRYCTATDGIRIAYVSVGKGVPLLHLRMPWSHLTAERDLIGGDADAAVIAMCNLVRFDPRGLGMSDRDVHDFTLEAMCRDVEAVVERERLGPLLMVTQDGYSSMVAITYAAHHPEQVLRMSLTEPRARVPRAYHDRVTHLIEAFPNDVRSIAEAMLRSARGWPEDSAMPIMAELARRAVNPATLAELWRAIGDWDVSANLANVRCATQLMYHPWSEYSTDAARELASAMPRARVVTIDDGDWVATTAAFFGAARPASAPPGTAQPAAVGRLTPREIEVLKLIAAGRSNREISEDLVLSERTVARHIANIYSKIDAHGRAEATAYALRHGLG